MNMDNIMNMQKELMEKVPHELREDIKPKVRIAIHMIEDILLYLSSCGHKPWRPEPLSVETQNLYLVALQEDLKHLSLFSPEEAKSWADAQNMGRFEDRKAISGLGVIEETIEYLVATVDPKASPLEEITDVLFFYMEQIILSGFTLEQIEAEYVRKHAENLERYRRAKEGDFRWNNRAEKEGL